jgi:superoxide dismutase, Fe-Mn family
MHALPKLRYLYDDLEPDIDARTLEIHYTKHHQAYVDKLNAAVKGTKYENMDINEILKNINEVPKNMRTAVRNYGGGHANHSLYWEVMGPDGGGEPGGALKEDIKKTFGSFDKFKEEIVNAGLNRFGSGYAWLVVDNGKLSVMSTANQDSPLSEGKTPILVVDVWEHAYYLNYQNRRNEYLQHWWDVVDWKKVEENYKRAMKK